MKKLFLASLFSTIVIPATFAATTTPWWLQPTVCRISTTNCYTSMGAGYDPEEWDTTSNCRGKKLICPEALTTGATEPTLMDKADISSGRNISTDFDVSVLADGCFGARKTSANGTLASINGQYVNVWCRGILDNADETVSTGEIATANQPTCARLAEDGYAAVLNGKCYGKYYNPAEYYIECGSGLIPTRLIVLNGADINAGPSSGTPTTMSDAAQRFETMLSTSQAQHAKYFKNAN